MLECPCSQSGEKFGNYQSSSDIILQKKGRLGEEWEVWLVRGGGDFNRREEAGEGE